MQSIKESVANVAASAKLGLDNTKAALQEKADKMSAHSATEKVIATEKKEERVHRAELDKLEAQEHNAAARHSGNGTYSYSTTGETGQSMGGHQMSALPGHGTGEPSGRVTEGTVKSHPIGTTTGTGRQATENNTHVGGAATNKGYGTGGEFIG